MFLVEKWGFFALDLGRLHGRGLGVRLLVAPPLVDAEARDLLGQSLAISKAGEGDS